LLEREIEKPCGGFGAKKFVRKNTKSYTKRSTIPNA
jgi:hypothetical protein